MDILFKITSLNPAVPNCVGDSNFQEHYTGINRNVAWGEVTPGIRQATEKFILPYIGDELYSDLTAKYKEGTTLTSEQKEILRMLQDASAYYMAYHLLPERTTFFSSMGMIQNTPSDGSGQPPPQWSWKAARWNALENGDTFLDKALNKLEEYVKAGVAYFDLWKNSKAYKVKTSSFFRHTEQLDEFLNIQNSRRSFISIVKYLREIEEDVIRPMICDDLFAALLVASPTTANQKLIPLIQKVVAYMGAANAIPHHRIVIDGDGFRVVSQTDQFDDRRNQTNNVHAEAIEGLRNGCELKGRKYLEDLKNFLETNSADYPLWTASACYTAPVSTGHTIVVASDGIGGILM